MLGSDLSSFLQSKHCSPDVVGSPRRAQLASRAGINSCLAGSGPGATTLLYGSRTRPFRSHPSTRKAEASIARKSAHRSFHKLLRIYPDAVGARFQRHSSSVFDKDKTKHVPRRPCLTKLGKEWMNIPRPPKTLDCKGRPDVPCTLGPL